MASQTVSDAAPDRPLSGGRLAVDLINTTWQDSGSAVDWLEHDAAVLEFTASHRHPTRSSDLTATRVALIEMRELISRLFASPSLAEAGDDLIEETARALRSARTTIDQSGDTPSLRTSGDQPTNNVAIEALVDAIDIVGKSRDRLRCCEHDECTLWFLDTSKGGRRRWCSMQTCGNRTKARRHHARTAIDTA